MARTDQAFLVGERDGAALGQRRICRLDAGSAGNRADHEIGWTQRGLDHRLGAGGRLDAAAGKRGFQITVEFFIADRGKSCADADGEFGERRHVASAGDCLDAEGLRRLFDDIDRRAADRTGRAEQDDSALFF